MKTIYKTCYETLIAKHPRRILTLSDICQLYNKYDIYACDDEADVYVFDENKICVIAFEAIDELDNTYEYIPFNVEKSSLEIFEAYIDDNASIKHINYNTERKLSTLQREIHHCIDMFDDLCAPLDTLSHLYNNIEIQQIMHTLNAITQRLEDAVENTEGYELPTPRITW